MSGHRDHGSPRGDDTDRTEVARVDDLLDDVLREEPALASALEALPAALDHVEVPAGAWDRLAAALPVLGAAGADEVTAARSSDRSVAGTIVAPAGEARYRRLPRWNWSHPLTWLGTAVVAAAVLGVGTWWAFQGGAQARLAEEQRVLAYWMANPDIRLVALREVGSGSEEPSSDAGPDLPGRLGVVCILPDGRALLLQPSPAGRGKSYVVVGRGGGEAELGSGTGNVIRFDLAGAERVVIMLASAGGERVPIAWADVN